MTASATRNPCFSRRAIAMTIWLASCVLAWLPATVGAQQQCTIEARPSVVNLSMTVTTNYERIGSVISDTATSSIAVSCPASRSGFRLLLNPTIGVHPANRSTWITAITGAGLRVTLNGRVVSTMNNTSPDLSKSIATIYSPNGYSGTYTLSHSLIKVAELVFPDDYPRFDLGVVYTLHSYDNATRTTSPPLAQVSITSSPPPFPTCTVSTPNVGVTLPTVSTTSLRTVGAAAGATPFSIGLRCRARARANVYITLTDATTPANRTNLLTLTADSTARGIGIRIRNPSNEPIHFGPDSSLANNPNQWQVGPSSTTTHIPMTAEYVSTGTVTPGTVRALSTFTMSYR